MAYECPVCGFPELDDPPRSSDGSASFEICPSCYFQFGFDDDDQKFSYEQWRVAWIERGMPWRAVGTEPPTGWNPAEQLRRAGLSSS
jgi:hypothetical protein